MNESTELEVFQIGELAKTTGKSVRALRLYEELGLLVPSKRSKGRFRLYDHDAVIRTQWITRLQDIGFSLPQIQELLRSWSHVQCGPEWITKIRSVFHQKLDETIEAISNLQQLGTELRESLAYLDGCVCCDPTTIITECVHCDQEREPPPLVAGFHSTRKN